MTENAKLRELFKRTKHTQLVESVKALEVRYDMDGLAYTQAANHLTAAVSKLGDYQIPRRITKYHAAFLTCRQEAGKAANQHVFAVRETRSTRLMVQSGPGTTKNGLQ